MPNDERYGYSEVQEMSQARLVIYRSPTGRDNWEPVNQSEVPDWVKEPRVMGRLVAGEMCCDTQIGDKGSDWYMARKVVSKEELAAQERREKRQAKRRAH